MTIHSRIYAMFLFGFAVVLMPFLSGCGSGFSSGGSGGGPASWIDDNEPAEVQVSSNAAFANPIFKGGPVTITMSVIGTDNISEEQATITPAIGGTPATITLKQADDGNYVGTYEVPANRNSNGSSTDYNVIVSAVADGAAISSLCSFSVPAASKPPSLPL